LASLGRGETAVVTIQRDIDGIETMLDEIEENVREAWVTDATARDLGVAASKLRHAIEAWRSAPPSRDVIADISVGVTDVLERSTALRRRQVRRVVPLRCH
jgi:hypothetical protein